MNQLHSRRRGQSRWAILAFLGCAVLVIWLVLEKYLMPALMAANNIDPIGRKHLAALSSLVLSVVLVVLLAGLFLVVRPGRFFLPRQGEKRSRTVYTDAWAESAKRMQTPPAEEEEDEEEKR